MYGAGANKISAQVTKDSGTYFSKSEAQEVIDDYFRQFHKLKAWIDKSSRFIMDNGFIYGATGRKRRLPNVNSDNCSLNGLTDKFSGTSYKPMPSTFFVAE